VHEKNREREGNLKLECGQCAHCRGTNIIILNWHRQLKGGDQDVVKRSGRVEPMWDVIHMCMEAMLGMSLLQLSLLQTSKNAMSF
jgi:hypothetical protein